MHDQESIQKMMPPRYKIVFREVRDAQLFFDIIDPDGALVISEITLPFIPLWISGYQCGYDDRDRNL